MAIPAVLSGLLLHGALLFVYCWYAVPAARQAQPPWNSIAINGGLGASIVTALLLVFKLTKPSRRVAWIYDLFGGGLSALSSIYLASAFVDLIRVEQLPVSVQFLIPISMTVWNLVGAVMVLWGIIKLSRDLLTEKDERRRLESLIAFTRTITSLDYQVTLNEAVHRLRRLLAADSCILLLWDDQTQLLVPVAGEHDSRIYQPEYIERVMSFRCPLGYGLTGWVMETGEPFTSGNVMADPHSQGVPGWKVDEKSSLVVPIQLEGKRLGVVRITRRGLDAFGRADLELALSFASQAGLVIDHVRMVNELSELTITDTLTGLFNARHFHRVLEMEVSRAARYEQPLALVMLDSDSLRQLNDRHGHAAGDSHLTAIAGVLREIMRCSDYGFRYAGDEFLLLLPNTTAADALTVAERVRGHVAALEPAPHFHASVSAGVAGLPHHATNGKSLLAAADAALDHSKYSGKNRSSLAGLHTRLDTIRSGG